MSDLIIKGKGVYYRDADGVMHPMSFPPEDSDHDKISHFYINSITGRPFEELDGEHITKWPMSRAAELMAQEIMEQGRSGESVKDFGRALVYAKEDMNEATRRFNAVKDKSGDINQKLPIPFPRDRGYQLDEEYMTNHYGSHQSRRIPSSDRKVRDDEGRLVNNHPNNKPHPTLGLHLESAALHMANELNDVHKERGYRSAIGAKQNVIEPQQITGGVTRRYSSNEKDPTSKENTVFPSHYADDHAQTAAYGQIKPADIISVLPNDFFVPSSSGNMSTETMNKFIRMGYDQPTARKMARAPVNQLMYGRGSDGAETGLRIVMDNIESILGIKENPDVKEKFIRHQSHFAPLVRGGDRGRNKAAIEIMAMLKTAEEMGIDMNSLNSYPAAPRSVMDGYREIASLEGGKQLNLADLGNADRHHEMRGKFNTNYDHLHDSFPAHLSSGTFDVSEFEDSPPVRPPEEELSVEPPVETTQRPSAIDPLATLGGSAAAGFGGFAAPASGFGGFDPRIQMSNDDPMGVIANIMERVQLHEAGGSLLIKYDPLNKYDMEKLAKEVGMTSVDVRAVAMSLGDWGVIAKSFNTTHDVVSIIKTSCGGAING